MAGVKNFIKLYQIILNLSSISTDGCHIILFLLPRKDSFVRWKHLSLTSAHIKLSDGTKNLCLGCATHYHFTEFCSRSMSVISIFAATNNPLLLISSMFATCSVCYNQLFVRIINVLLLLKLTSNLHKSINFCLFSAIGDAPLLIDWKTIYACCSQGELSPATT